MARVLYVPESPYVDPAFRDVEDLEDKQALIGGYIDRVEVAITDGRVVVEMYCNEEGLLRKMPVNSRASASLNALTSAKWGNPFHIRGPVYLTGGTDEQGEDQDFPWPDSALGVAVYSALADHRALKHVKRWWDHTYPELKK